MFATYMQAMNAAKKQYGPAYKESVDFEKIDGQWSVQVKQIEQPIQNDVALTIEREGEFRFPKGEDFEQIEAQEIDPEADDRAFVAAAQAEADRQATQAQITDAPGKGKKEWVHVSTVEKPTKRVWAIADEMIAEAEEAGETKPTRAEIQDECVRRGIASGTARTQYQAWKKANDNDRVNAASAAAASAKFNHG